MRIRGRLAALAWLLVGLFSPTARSAPVVDPDGWRFLLPGLPGSVSGLVRLPAPPGSTRWLVAHDVKTPKEGPPLHRIHVAPDGSVAVAVVPWPAEAEFPFDLEALAGVPGRPLDVLAVESRGNVFHLRLTPDHAAASFRRKVSIPSPPKQIEGFALERIPAGVVATWSGRGDVSGDTVLPADLRWGRLEWDAGGALAAVVETGRAQVTAPWPPSGPPAGAARFTRHVADLHLRVDGRLLAVSAFDPGNTGPFVSAVWEAGRFSAGASGPAFAVEASPRVSRRFARKCEALCAGPCGLAFASDDEDEGGWLLLR